MRLWVSLSLAAFLLLVFSPSMLYGQSTKAELFGVVRDPAGLPVGGAAVDLVNTGTEGKLSVQSGTAGNYNRILKHGRKDRLLILYKSWEKKALCL